MTTTILTRDQVRAVDRRAIEVYGISGLVLMENAGRGVADRVCRLMGTLQSDVGNTSEKIVICCGKGNNAGDGFVVARHLDLRDFDVHVLLWAEPAALTGDAAVNFQILEKTDVSVEIFSGRHDPKRLEGELAGATWILDALLGTGARGEPRPPFDAVIDQLNATATPKLAVDLPSGLDCDTGEPARHTVRAIETCTFVAAKPGFFAPGADQYTGHLQVLDIGTPRKLVEEILADTG